MLQKMAAICKPCVRKTTAAAALANNAAADYYTFSQPRENKSNFDMNQHIKFAFDHCVGYVSWQIFSFRIMRLFLFRMRRHRGRMEEQKND